MLLDLHQTGSNLSARERFANCGALPNDRPHRCSAMTSLQFVDTRASRELLGLFSSIHMRCATLHGSTCRGGAHASSALCERAEIAVKKSARFRCGKTKKPGSRVGRSSGLPRSPPTSLWHSPSAGAAASPGIARQKHIQAPQPPFFGLARASYRCRTRRDRHRTRMARRLAGASHRTSSSAAGERTKGDAHPSEEGARGSQVADGSIMHRRSL
jgi:hypothetical protein